MARYRIVSDPAETVDGWTSCALSKPASDADPDLSLEPRAALQNLLAETVAADQLVILAGLGTSLEIFESDGNTPKFPTMEDLWRLVGEKTGPAFAEVRKA